VAGKTLYQATREGMGLTDEPVPAAPAAPAPVAESRQVPLGEEYEMAMAQAMLRLIERAVK
jgi:hypothetical protein